MSVRTGIQWTDATWNPVVGCDQVSPGCAHCYAKQLHDQRHRASEAGHLMAKQYRKPFEVIQLKEERLLDPASWRQRKRVFVNSVSDLFHEDVPFDYIDRVFAAMALACWHTYQILTKRPERMREYFLTRNSHLAMTRQFRNFATYEKPVGPWPLPNVWLGVSVENQRWADERIPLLLQTPAATRFLSCEPLLGPVDLTRVVARRGVGWIAAGDTVDALRGETREAATGALVDEDLPGIDWVIVGGESGPKARPMDLDWARGLRDQCAAAGVAFFFKQVGGRSPKSGGRELDGRTWDGFPAPAAGAA